MGAVTPDPFKLDDLLRRRMSSRHGCRLRGALLGRTLACFRVLEDARRPHDGSRGRIILSDPRHDRVFVRRFLVADDELGMALHTTSLAPNGLREDAVLLRTTLTSNNHVLGHGFPLHELRHRGMPAAIRQSRAPGYRTSAAPAPSTTSAGLAFLPWDDAPLATTYKCSPAPN